MTPLLVFDGECGFCTRSLGWLRLVDRKRLIETAPYQRAGVPEQLGISREQCAASVQWRGADGSRAEGAEAVNAALSFALGTRWPERVYRHSTGVQRRLYRWVAENRRRLPGMTPWCARYPDDCA